MKNWMGQVIQVGDVVYRGARQGNSSNYKVCIVRKTLPDKKKATIEWFFEPGNIWIKDSNTYLYNVPRRPGFWSPEGATSSGTSDVNGLVVIDRGIFDELELRYEAAKRARSQEEYEKSCEFYINLGYIPMP